MKMKKLLSLLLAACVLVCVCASASADAGIFAGGSGTEEDPYQIATADQLVAFAASVNDGSAKVYGGQFIVLTEDLDLTGIDWTPIRSMADMET